MKITIHEPQAIWEIGGRANNEDNIFPTLGEATPQNTTFVVCDGVGGQVYGEVASKLVAETIGNYQFSKNVINDFDTVVKIVQQAIDNYIKEQPNAEAMATTLTALHISDSGITIAHCGDSRIYHIRQKKILHRTEDHSLVNEWLKAGIISSEQASNHQQKNIITRALQSSKNPAQAEIHHISDIMPNDYFFLCTDGILEQITDDYLLSVLNENTTLHEKTDKIKNTCLGKTKDNFSAYLLQIQDVEIESKKSFLQRIFYLLSKNK